MSQLRSQVAQLRQETATFRAGMEAAKARLRPRADQARAERVEAKRQLRRDFGEGKVDPADRALVARVLDGQTTWHAVMNGQDVHPTATGYRARLTDQVRGVVDHLNEVDQDLSDDLKQTRRGSEAARGCP